MTQRLSPPRQGCCHLLLPLVWLVILVRRYRRHGVDPDIPAATVVRYEPPEGVSAGAIGTLVDERVDMADITATKTLERVFIAGNEVR